MSRELQISLEQLIGEVTDFITKFCNEKVEFGFDYDGKKFSMSPSDQINYTNLLILPESVFPQNFPCKDMSTYRVTQSNRQALYQASAQHKMKWEGLRSTYIAYILNCKTNQEVLNHVETLKTIV